MPGFGPRLPPRARGPGQGLLGLGGKLPGGGVQGDIQGYYWDSIDPLRIVRFLAEVISGTIGERDRIVPGTGRESLFVRKKFLETAKGLALKAGPAIFRGVVNETGRWWEEANVLARAAEAVEGKIFNLDLTENVRRHGEFERILAGLEYFPPGRLFQQPLPVGRIPAGVDAPYNRRLRAQGVRFRAPPVVSRTMLPGRPIIRKYIRERYSPVIPSTRSWVPEKMEMIEARKGKPGIL